MALFSAKQLLDELMGRDRDLGLDDKKNEFSWDGPDVCKHFLVKFCPNDLFVNTKADLGTCPKIHDERLKKEYEKSSRFQKMGYEDDFLHFCQSMLSDVDKRIRRAKQRLALNNAAAEAHAPAVKNNEEQIEVLTDKINKLLVQVENLGCEGKVEEAQGIMKLCDQLREEREAMRKPSDSNSWFQGNDMQEKQMEVCEVCGAFLIVGDAQQRVDDHLMGKQHVGYDKLKKVVEDVMEAREKERAEREKVWAKEREERRKARGSEHPREERVHRGRPAEDRPRRRSRSKDRAHRGRSHRSRSRERRAHSKGRDRERHHRRSKSPGKRKERSRSCERRPRRSRSRSGDRHKEKRAKKDHKDREDRGKSSHENGVSGERSKGADEGVKKEHHSSGD